MSRGRGCVLWRCLARRCGDSGTATRCARSRAGRGVLTALELRGLLGFSERLFYVTVAGQPVAGPAPPHNGYDPPPEPRPATRIRARPRGCWRSGGVAAGAPRRRSCAGHARRQACEWRAAGWRVPAEPTMLRLNSQVLGFRIRDCRVLRWRLAPPKRSTGVPTLPPPAACRPARSTWAALGRPPAQTHLQRASSPCPRCTRW